MPNDTTIDVRHLGRVEYVSAHLLFTGAGPVLLDTGPGSTLPALERGLAGLGLGVTDLHAVLLSHIHFDHAGAAGLLVERHPSLPVYVHQLGARHLIDPAKLVASATRIYGDQMDRLWGRFLPIPAENIRTLAGDETIELGGRRFEVIHAPGHAVHHVIYYEAADRTAYLGDCGGIRVPALPLAMPVTPPPDFHLEEWRATIARVRAWRPRRIFSTHYGFYQDVEAHLEALEAGLLDWTATVARLLEEELSEDERAERFSRHVHGWLAGRASADAIETFAAFADFRGNYHGIARYWRKGKGGG